MSDIIFLYETSGLAAAPFVERGFSVYCYDILNINEEKYGAQCFYWDAFSGFEEIVSRHDGKAVLVFGFPPCTDLAVSGAKHFYKKSQANPNFQKEAMSLVYKVPEVGKTLGCTWAFENPVSVISTKFRKFDYKFEPFEYGGYLPEDDIHPEFPQYIEPRDAYPKPTCLWTSSDFIMPPKIPVRYAYGWSKQTTKLGGKSARTKYIRSLSPRGFFTALAMQMAGEI